MTQRGALIILLAFGLSSCGLAAFRSEDRIGPLSKAVLVYMAACNSLDPYALEDLDDIAAGMRACDADSGVFVLVSRRRSNAFEDWDDTRLFFLRGGVGEEWRELDAPSIGLSVDYTDEYLDMSDPSILRAFIRTISLRFPAREWYLDIWNHGGGWKGLGGAREIAYDEMSGSAMSLKDLRRALRFSFLDKPIVHFKMILADACYMGSLEAASDMMGNADYYIASSDAVPASGFPYDEFLPIILGSSVADEKCRMLCESYGDEYGGQGSGLCAVKIDADNALARFLTYFNEEIPRIDRDALRDAIDRGAVKPEGSRDIKVFEVAMPGFRTAKDALFAGLYSPDGESLSIYLNAYPLYDADWDCFEAEHVHYLELDGAYRDFLSTYLHSGLSNADSYEPNGKAEIAASIAGGSLSAMIWCPGDIDYYAYTFQGCDLNITMNPPLGDDYDLRVILRRGSSEAKRITSEAMGDAAERIQIKADEVSLGEKVLIEVYGPGEAYDQKHAYRLLIE